MGAVKGSTSQIASQISQMSRTSAQASQETVAAIKSSAFSMRDLVTSIVTMGTVWKSYSIAKQFVELGIETNAGIQSAKLGIAGLITAQTTLRDSTGQALEGSQALAGAMTLATDQVQKLRIAAIQTSATTSQLVQAYQAALGAGLGAGLTLDQIREITVRIVQAAGAMGVPMGQIRQEVTSILRMQIDQNSVVAKALQLGNDELKQWQQRGEPRAPCSIASRRSALSARRSPRAGRA